MGTNLTMIKLINRNLNPPKIVVFDYGESDVTIESYTDENRKRSVVVEYAESDMLYDAFLEKGYVKYVE